MASEVRDPLLKKLRGIGIAALEERRGLVVYSRMDAQEMDRLARQVERDALEKIGAITPLGPSELFSLLDDLRRPAARRQSSEAEQPTVA